MDANSDDERMARLLLLLRRRHGLSQIACSTLARVPRRDVQRIEAGSAGQVPLDRLRRIFEASGGRGRFSVWWNGAAADRLLDERHASLVEKAVAVFDQRHWVTRVEVSFSEYGERGSVDVLAGYPRFGAVAVCEVKSEIGSLEAMNRVLDAKVRLAPRLCETAFGWKPSVVGRLLILPDESGPRRTIARHQRTMQAIYPARAREVRAWLWSPTFSFGGVWFLSDARHRSVVATGSLGDPPR